MTQDKKPQLDPAKDDNQVTDAELKEVTKAAKDAAEIDANVDERQANTLAFDAKQQDASDIPAGPLAGNTIDLSSPINLATGRSTLVPVALNGGERIGGTVAEGLAHVYTVVGDSFERRGIPIAFIRVYADGKVERTEA